MTIPAKYDEVGRDHAATYQKVFSEGLASVKQNGKWGFIDGHVKQNGKWGFIDRKISLKIDVTKHLSAQNIPKIIENGRI